MVKKRKKLFTNDNTVMLQGISVLARIGGNDRTVHPFFVRRMVRVLRSWGVNVSYTELPGKEHWWWDTV